MKHMILIALLAVSQFSMAAAGKAERELTRERAKEIMDSKDTASKEKYLSSLADMAGKAGKVNGLSLNIKKALLQGDADLLILVYKSIDKKDEATLKFIGEASAGVKTMKEASTLAKLAGMDEATTGKFKVELAKTIEEGKSLEEGMKIASAKIGKTGKDEITMEKIQECVL